MAVSLLISRHEIEIHKRLEMKQQEKGSKKTQLTGSSTTVITMTSLIFINLPIKTNINIFFISISIIVYNLTTVI